MEGIVALNSNTCKCKIKTLGGWCQVYFFDKWLIMWAQADFLLTKKILYEEDKTKVDKQK